MTDNPFQTYLVDENGDPVEVTVVQTTTITWTRQHPATIEGTEVLDTFIERPDTEER